MILTIYMSASEQTHGNDHHQPHGDQDSGEDRKKESPWPARLAVFVTVIAGCATLIIRIIEGVSMAP